MGVMDLQEIIKREEGFILSDGTLNLAHLLSKAYDLITAFNIENDELLKDILSVFTLYDEIDDEESLYELVFWGEAKINDDKLEDASWIWSDVHDFLCSLAPEGYYFGNTEGDGACVGFFKDDDEY